MAEVKRQTAQRAAIEQVFNSEQRPLTVEDIVKLGRNYVHSLNQATVYRNLKVLLKDGWLRQIHHPAFGNLYEKAEIGHHHHFHCRICGRLFSLEVCTCSNIDQAPKGFITLGHDVFLFGSCPSCSR
ncbi:MAG: transcriptional repressor [Deltaproteobacteria bacterium]|nr:transcriptional repressor [Deltaproteobacteria bacterium]